MNAALFNSLSASQFFQRSWSQHQLLCDDDLARSALYILVFLFVIGLKLSELCQLCHRNVSVTCELCVCVSYCVS